MATLKMGTEPKAVHWGEKDVSFLLEGFEELNYEHKQTYRTGNLP